MQKFSLFQIPLLSFYSKDLYRDAAFNWKGVGFGYLFLLVLGCLIPQALQSHYELSAYMKKEAPAIVSQVPDVIFVEGVASTQATQPYIIKNIKTGKPFFIIDTTGTITNLDQTDGAIGLLTKSEVIVKKSAVETRTFSLKEIKHYTLNQMEASKWIDVLSQYTIMVLSPFMLIGNFIVKIILVLIYAVIGMMFAAMLKTKLPYAALLRLSIIAITPGMVVNALLQLTKTPIDQPQLLLFATALFYLFMGVQACSTVTSEPTSDSTPTLNA
jgi:Protein of unknown function (DUF1189)